MRHDLCRLRGRRADSLLRGRPWIGVTLVGVAFAVKLQAVLLFPVLLALLLTGRLRRRHLIPVPVTYVLLAVPAWLAGHLFRRQQSPPVQVLPPSEVGNTIAA